MIKDLRAFYEENGVDYDSFLRRLMGKEILVQKYINLFLSDSTYAELKQAVHDHNYDQVLAKAHTLKGVALNIELKDLSRFAADIVTSIRAGKTEDTDKLFFRLQSEYERITAALQA